VHGAGGQHKNALKTRCAGAVFNAFEHFFAVALALRRR
jgi:hypothetical protein